MRHGNGNQENGNSSREITSMLSQWSTTAVLITLYIAAAAAATFIEADKGPEAARTIVYHSWWFIGINLLLALNFILIGVRRNLWQRKRWGSLALHYGLAVTLLGALITHLWGYEGTMHIREGETADKIVLDGHRIRKVPFSIRLDDFTLERYHGSSAPSSYESDVTITHKGEATCTRIFMNNIARVGGFRIYQSSYDRDEKGTVLSVNHDPAGTAVTYAGYLLLVLGCILVPIQKGSRLRTLYGQLARAVLPPLLFLAGGNDTLHATPSESSIAPPAIGKETGVQFGSLAVRTPAGRIAPVESYASELLRKLSHRDRYKGMDGTQVLGSIIAFPLQWQQETLIYIDSEAVRERLGIEGEYARYTELFDAQGDYLLAGEADRIYRKPPRLRNKQDREVLKLDEKADILYELFSGGMLALFPAGENGQWLSETELASAPREDSLRISGWMNAYRQALRQGDTSAAASRLTQIARFQNERFPELERQPIRAELLYNRADIFRNCFRGYLIAGALLMLALFATGQNGRHTFVRILRWVIVLLFLFHTAGLGLRWHIGGHAPWANAYESVVYVAWATVLSGMIFAGRAPLVLALATLLGGTVLFVSNLNWLDPQITPLVPVLKSYWLMIHVSVVTASYGFFGICAMCGLASLTAIATGRKPGKLAVVNEMSMQIGTLLLTVGIFFGAVWANESWGRYWGWDPKETWALITLLVYTLALHARFIRPLDTPYAFAVLSVVGIYAVLMTFFGVNYYLSGLHSYGNSGGIPLKAVIAGTLPVLLLFIVAGLRHRKTLRP